mmetsp:Transcript_26096/g.35616  ORF Transcript_26096/g.35616 Transcript_26096/m.35616 type:complete len:171 (+) Transcript_26096:465-977(+)
MIPLANKKGFKVVMIGYRGTGGMKVTHGKTYASASWRDIKEPVDYIKKTYCQDRRMHLYACSLGATICCNYLARDEKAPFESAIFYGTPFNIVAGVDHIRTNMYGLYNWAFGAGLKEKLRKQWPEFEVGATKYQKKMYKRFFEQEGCNLTDIDEWLFAPMFGFKNAEDYY